MRIGASRKYKSGTGWCFWRWTDVRSEYIVRLHIVKTPWFAICLHWIKKADPEPWLHDHPVTFLSVILRGAYCERRPHEGKCHCGGHMRRWFNFVRATDAHTITWTAYDTMTLALMGPKTREWGFYTPSGWQFWKDYYAAK